MKLNRDNGKYVLQNQLRTWSEYKQERAARESISQPGASPAGRTPIKIPARKNTADLFRDDPEVSSRTPPMVGSGSPLALSKRATGGSASLSEVEENALDEENPGPGTTTLDTVQEAVEESSFSKVPVQGRPERRSILLLRGRDGGGTRSGAGSMMGSSSDEEIDPLAEGSGSDTPRDSTRAQPVQPRSLARAMRGGFSEEGRALADALGDHSDAEVDQADAQMGDKERERQEQAQIIAAERRERNLGHPAY